MKHQAFRRLASLAAMHGWTGNPRALSRDRSPVQSAEAAQLKLDKAQAKRERKNRKRRLDQAGK